mgnify:CR=1 FL=1
MKLALSPSVIAMLVMIGGLFIIVRGEVRELIQVHSFSFDEALMQPGSSWRVWGTDSMTPRLFLTPLIDNSFILGWTSAADQGGRVTKITNTFEIEWTRKISQAPSGGPLVVRGLIGHDDGSFAALLHDPGFNGGDPHIFVRKVNSNGDQEWQVELMNRGGWIPNKPTDFHIGDSRLSYDSSNQLYTAYYHVHSDSGHEGDSLHQITDAGINSTRYDDVDNLSSLLFFFISLISISFTVGFGDVHIQCQSC